MDIYRNSTARTDALLRTSIVRGLGSNDALARQFETGAIRTCPAGRRKWKHAGDAANAATAPQGARSRRARVYDRAASRQRKRMYGADGHMPPHLRCWFTESARAVLSIIAIQVKKNKRCTLEVGVLARLAGVSMRTVQYTLALASGKGRDRKPAGHSPDGPPVLVLVQYRNGASGWKNEPNLVTIVSNDWQLWLGFRPKDMARAGCKHMHTTQNPIKSRGCDGMIGSAGRGNGMEEGQATAEPALPLTGGSVTRVLKDAWRRGDAVKMGWQHVAGDRISVRQQKTSARLEIRLHARLREVLAVTSRDNLTFLLTSFGKPFTPAGFGNWFRERCDEAGLPQCSAHGLRKAAARRLAEAGCSNSLINAITGHTTDKEVARYTKAAE